MAGSRVALIALLATFAAACSIVSGSDGLTGGVCRHCADAAPGKPIACGASTCDTSKAWCCMAGDQAVSCSDPCPSGAAALACFGPADCTGGATCCSFSSNHQGQTEERRFSQCQPSCGANDEVVCDPATGIPCPAGKTCTPSGISRISVCR